MDYEKACAVLKARKAQPYRARQLARAVFRGAAMSYDEIKILPADLREALERKVPLIGLSASRTTRSKDGTVKVLLDLDAGGQVESVLMRPASKRWTVCISTQTGCSIGCRFCATAKAGAGRNLSAVEIADQVLFWRRFLKKEHPEEHLSNIVYMGMGEPFLNYDNFAGSLRMLIDQYLFGIGARHVSVSTSGLAPQMERFAKDFPQVNLALSLHAANDALRDRLVPINRAYPLAMIARTLKNVFVDNNRKVFVEYVILKGENDSPEDAADLVAFVRSISAKLLHVNLLLFNPSKGSAGKPALSVPQDLHPAGPAPKRPAEASPETVGNGAVSTEADARRFQSYIREAGLICTVRQSFGRDIGAACGQLAARAGTASRGLPSPSPFRRAPRTAAGRRPDVPAREERR